MSPGGDTGHIGEIPHKAAVPFFGGFSHYPDFIVCRRADTVMDIAHGQGKIPCMTQRYQYVQQGQRIWSA